MSVCTRRGAESRSQLAVWSDPTACHSYPPLTLRAAGLKRLASDRPAGLTPQSPVPLPGGSFHPEREPLLLGPLAPGVLLRLPGTPERWRGCRRSVYQWMRRKPVGRVTFCRQESRVALVPADDSGARGDCFLTLSANKDNRRFWGSSGQDAERPAL